MRRYSYYVRISNFSLLVLFVYMHYAIFPCVMLVIDEIIGNSSLFCFNFKLNFSVFHNCVCCVSHIPSIRFKFFRQRWYFQEHIFFREKHLLGECIIRKFIVFGLSSKDSRIFSVRRLTVHAC